MYHTMRGIRGSIEGALPPSAVSITIGLWTAFREGRQVEQDIDVSFLLGREKMEGGSNPRRHRGSKRDVENLGCGGNDLR